MRLYWSVRRLVKGRSVHLGCSPEQDTWFWRRKSRLGIISLQGLVGSEIWRHYNSGIGGYFGCWLKWDLMLYAASDTPHTCGQTARLRCSRPFPLTTYEPEHSHNGIMLWAQHGICSLSTQSWNDGSEDGVSRITKLVCLNMCQHRLGVSVKP